jgi:hypothetical protein
MIQPEKESGFEMQDSLFVLICIRNGSILIQGNRRKKDGESLID